MLQLLPHIFFPLFECPVLNIFHIFAGCTMLLQVPGCGMFFILFPGFIFSIWCLSAPITKPRLVRVSHFVLAMRDILKLHVKYVASKNPFLGQCPLVRGCSTQLRQGHHWRMSNLHGPIAKWFLWFLLIVQQSTWCLWGQPDDQRIPQILVDDIWPWA